MKETITDVINRYIDFRLEQVHTSIPGIIQSYDSANKIADVKPAVNTVTGKGQKITLPIIRNVPVVFPSSRNFVLEWDLVKNDEVALFFTEAGIGNWIMTDVGRVVDADDEARHALTDAFCIPGIWPKGKAPEGLARIKIDNSLFVIENQTKNLLSLVEGLIDVIKSVQTVDFKALSPASIAQLEVYKLQFRGLLK